MWRPLLDFFQIVVPPVCCCCGEELVGAERFLCADCLLHLPFTHSASEVGNDSEQCFMGRVPIEAAASLFLFSRNCSARSLVHNIKYQGGVSLAVSLGMLLGEDLAKSGRFDNVDCVLPVPLYPYKYLKRGYNQSTQLAKGVAAVLQKPLVTGVLYRTRHTATQTKKGREERGLNMRGAFAVRRAQKIEQKHVLLVDDVLTTGATTIACCRALLEVPGVKVSVATLAKAI